MNENEVYIHPNTTCYETFKQIHINLNLLWFKGNWVWIRSHQESMSSMKMILNNLVDKLATKQRITRTSCKKWFTLTNSKLTVFHYENLQKVLHHVYTKTDSETYPKENNISNDEQIDRINWIHLGSALKSQDSSSRVSLVKLMIGWENCRVQNHNIEGITEKNPSLQWRIRNIRSSLQMQQEKWNTDMESMQWVSGEVSHHPTH